MTEGMWIALISGSFLLAGGLVTAVVTVLNIVAGQSKSIAEERDYWRSVALQERTRNETEAD